MQTWTRILQPHVHTLSILYTYFSTFSMQMDFAYPAGHGAAATTFGVGACPTCHRLWIQKIHTSRARHVQARHCKLYWVTLMGESTGITKLRM
jgi:hypothetical protein